MQAENEALQALVVDVAANKAEARKRVAALKEKYSELLAKVDEDVPLGLMPGTLLAPAHCPAANIVTGMSATYTCMLRARTLF